MGYHKRKTVDITEELATSYSKKLEAYGDILIFNGHFQILAVRESQPAGESLGACWYWDSYSIQPFECKALFGEGEPIKPLHLVHTDGGVFEGEAEEAILFLLS